MVSEGEEMDAAPPKRKGKEEGERRSVRANI